MGDNVIYLYIVLKCSGKCEAGETVLVHGASGAVSVLIILQFRLVAWSNSRTSVFGRRAFAVLRLTCS